MLLAVIALTSLALGVYGLKRARNVERHLRHLRRGQRKQESQLRRALASFAFVHMSLDKLRRGERES